MQPYSIQQARWPRRSHLTKTRRVGLSPCLCWKQACILWNTHGDETLRSWSSTVGLPLAVAAKRILDGTIARRGVVMPTLSDVYTPVLSELSEWGITFRDEVVPLP